MNNIKIILINKKSKNKMNNLNYLKKKKLKEIKDKFKLKKYYKKIR